MLNENGDLHRAPTSLLLLNGGVGSRLKLGIPKQFHEVLGHPLMAYSIIAATKIDAITEIIINAPSGYEARTEEVLNRYAPNKTFKLVKGGATRQMSTRILAQSASNDSVILHETARPLVTSGMFQALLEHQSENAGYFDDIPFSMCDLDEKTRTIRANVPRDRVFNIQLPQKFDRNTLVSAHDAALDANKTFTEDAVMVHEMANTPVHALDGDPRNIKVTTPSDVVIVSQLMNEEVSI